MGIQATALLVRLNAVGRAVDELAKAVEPTFRTHPDAPVMPSSLESAPESVPGPWPISVTTAPALPLRAGSRACR
ncbi:hypothetical protein ACFU98_17170 [Streptomyces sp. NPDC057575]|uniref:hypothetical protein n=1 Tax=unclassified Streptomyces TaxID=2593676 RepID=UPI00368BDDEB